MKLSVTAAVLTTLVARATCQSLPQVDLGYEIHQAISYDDVYQTYNFSNIRYAQPPVGDLRFAAPVPPTGRNPVVQNGSFSPICPQAFPGWLTVGTAFAESFALGNVSNFNYNETVAAAQAAAASAPPYSPSPQETEDCLFLDVIVPKSIFDNANNLRRRQRGKSGAPVLVWQVASSTRIFGGAYAYGSKYSASPAIGGAYDPDRLINASQANGGQGVIYVAMNYRLGALGWLAGPSFQQQGGTSNAALYDQRLAIEWVKQYIHLFGGDPEQITLLGQSAGGGSIMHQITAYGGQQPVPFQRAIPQSPGWFPVSSPYIQESAAQRFYSNLNVTTLAEARSASTAAVITANLLTVYGSLYGQFSFGPVVDGIFVPAQPGLALLTHIAYAKNLSLLIGHSTNEGPLFAPPYVQTNDELKAYIHANYPAASPAVLDEFVTEIYPPVYDGTYPWTSPLDRTIHVVAEQIFSCNTNYLARAYDNRTYNYEYAVYPALHGSDLLSTFYLGQGTDLSQGLYAPVADALQTYITNFAVTGDPNLPSLISASTTGGSTLPYFPIQGNNATEMVLNYTITGPTSIEPAIGIGIDPTVNSRCDFLQKGLYL